MVRAAYWSRSDSWQHFTRALVSWRVCVIVCVDNIFLSVKNLSAKLLVFCNFQIFQLSIGSGHRT